jgi:ribose 5-phosphate isomerase B
MKLYISSDHTGFELKKGIIDFAKKSLGLDMEDLGPFSLDPLDDYPIYIRKVAAKVSEDPEHVKGIVLGRSGQGEAMASNRFPNVRAAVYYGGPLEIIKLCRQHNDSNILSLGSMQLSEVEAFNAVKLWIETQFSEEERHVRRIKEIEEPIQ